MEASMTKSEAEQFIKELYGKIAAQDNRCTAPPYYYCICETKEHYVPVTNQLDGYLYDGTFYDGAAAKLLIKEDESLLKSFEHHAGYAFSDDADTGDIESFMEDVVEATPVEILPIEVYHGHFYTEEAAQAHLDANKHRYNKPGLYVEYNARNPEAVKLLEAMKAIAAG